MHMLRSEVEARKKMLHAKKEVNESSCIMWSETLRIQFLKSRQTTKTAYELHFYWRVFKPVLAI